MFFSYCKFFTLVSYMFMEIVTQNNFEKLYNCPIPKPYKTPYVFGLLTHNLQNYIQYNEHMLSLPYMRVQSHFIENTTFRYLRLYITNYQSTVIINSEYRMNQISKFSVNMFFFFRTFFERKKQQQNQLSWTQLKRRCKL